MTQQLPKHILNTLNDGLIHSGESLGKKFSVTRTAIWKTIAQLKKNGAPIETIARTGYQLRHPIEWLDASLITKHFSAQTRECISHVHIFETIDSTNRFLMDQLSAPHATVCLAEQQTAGKGRLGRVWQSPLAGNIYLSLLWRFNEGISKLQGLSLVIGVALATTLESIGVPVQLKWPNDVLVAAKKLAGILIEVSGDLSGPTRVVIGVGVNVSLSKAQQQQIAQPTASLRELGIVMPPRNELVAIMINEMCAALLVFEQFGLAPFIDRWKKLDANAGRSVTLVHQYVSISGIARGIDHYGNLLLECAEGMRVFQSGEVSLRTPNQK